MGNKVTLTFAGDKKQLQKTLDQVGSSLRGFKNKVKETASGFPDIGKKAGGLFSLSFIQRIGPLMASAPISPPLVAAFAAAAPLAGAALVGGILLALGGGVLAAGIMSAVKDPKVSKAFGGLKERAGKAFENFGEPFKAPLIRAADTFGDSIERVAPAFQRMGVAMAPLIDKLAPALATMFEKAMPGIEKAVTASVPMFEKLAEHAPAIGEAVSKFFEKVAEAGPKAVDLLDKVLKFATWALPKLGAVLSFLVGFYSKGLAAWQAIFRGIGAGWDWVATKAGQAKNWIVTKWNEAIAFLKGLPGRASSAFSGMFDGVKSAFRSALNWVIDRWNNFSIPGVSTPFGQIGGFSTPNIPRFHQGGTMPGAPGTEGLALLQAGEKVTPAGRSSDRVVLEIRSDGTRYADLLVETLAKAVKVRGGDVQLVLGTG